MAKKKEKKTPVAKAQENMSPPVSDEYKIVSVTPEQLRELDDNKLLCGYNPLTGEAKIKKETEIK